MNRYWNRVVNGIRVMVFLALTAGCTADPSSNLADGKNRQGIFPLDRIKPELPAAVADHNPNYEAPKSPELIIVNSYNGAGSE